MVSSEDFCLRWNSFESNISGSFQELQEDSEFFDVTLCCDNGIDIVQAHKVILAACSPFFRKILSHQKNQQNPLLYLKGICLKDLQIAIKFMYHGEVNIARESLNNFLEVAEDLEIKGLSTNSKLQAPKPEAPKLEAPKTPAKKTIIAKRKNILQQETSLTPQTAKRPKTSQVFTPVENKENLMARNSKQSQNNTQIDIGKIIEKNSKHLKDLGQVENYVKIHQFGNIENEIIKNEPISKDIIDYHTGTNEQSDDYSLDQNNFDNNVIKDAVDYHREFEDFEDENEFEDSTGFVESSKDTTPDPIEIKGIGLLQCCCFYFLGVPGIYVWKRLKYLQKVFTQTYFFL